jgi:hypothetical protein
MAFHILNQKMIFHRVLKRHEILDLWYVHKITPPRPLIHGLKPFWIWGLTMDRFRSQQCYWTQHRCFRSRFSSRIRNHIQNGFKLCIKGLGRVVWWKNQMSKILCQVPFKYQLVLKEPWHEIFDPWFFFHESGSVCRHFSAGIKGPNNQSSAHLLTDCTNCKKSLSPVFRHFAMMSYSKMACLSHILLTDKAF